MVTNPTLTYVLPYKGAKIAQNLAYQLMSKLPEFRPYTKIKMVELFKDSNTFVAEVQKKVGKAKEDILLRKVLETDYIQLDCHIKAYEALNIDLPRRLVWLDKQGLYPDVSPIYTDAPYGEQPFYAHVDLEIDEASVNLREYEINTLNSLLEVPLSNELVSHLGFDFYVKMFLKEDESEDGLLPQDWYIKKSSFIIYVLQSKLREVEATFDHESVEYSYH